MKNRLILGGMLVLLAACSGLPVQPQPQPAPETAPIGGPLVVPELEPEFEPAAPAVPPSSTNPSNTDGAVDELLSEAIQLRDQGDIEGAIAVTERALRIAPRSPRVYYVLGTLKLDKGEAEQALQLALKASSLDTDNFYRRSIDRLIADCEAAIGSWK